ncbi:MAG: hypothetical protein GY839_17570 [candidate division Zixibacteria bacterium]|nr:hypothetical protein [candidate division Zixibacteria bacterium]
MPSSFNGCTWIRSANDSKTYTGTTLVSFTINDNADVYVAHNDLITSKPTWLADWIDSGENIVNNESPANTFSLYQKNYVSGSTVSLGNNGNTSESMYTIIIKPASSGPLLTVDPTTLSYGTALTSMSFNITNSGTDVLSWSAAENPDRTWITSVTPASGSLNASEQAGGDGDD